jgi:hypothetical protein
VLEAWKVSCGEYRVKPCFIIIPKHIIRYIVMKKALDVECQLSGYSSRTIEVDRADVIRLLNHESSELVYLQPFATGNHTFAIEVLQPPVSRENLLVYRRPES